MKHNTAKRRVFVGISMPDTLQRDVAEWRARYATLPVRWLSKKNLHITLVPPWYEDDLEDAQQRLVSVRSKPFALRFSRVGFGPSPRKPRLIWAKGETPAELVSLRQKVHEALGIQPEERPFRLHLTLARFRPEYFSEFPTRQLDEKVNWHMEVSSFTLMESRLSPQGADYEKLFEFQLEDQR